MKKIIILLCLALIAMTAFASCGSGEQASACEHPLSAEWDSNETTHWHPTECEHGEFRGEPEAHVDVDEDGLCDSCKYEMGHECTYPADWSSDAYGHWKVSTCTHAKSSDYAPHVDDDQNGECDECQGHVHILDATGRCAGCNTQVRNVDTSNLSQVIAAILGGHVNVNGGNIVYNRIMRNPGVNTYDAVIDYIIGNNSINLKEYNSADVTSTDRDGNSYDADTASCMEKWYNLESDNTVFGAYRETISGVAGTLSVNPAANEDTLYGYYYSVSTLASGYGAEGILKALYDKSQQEYASDFEVVTGDGTYKFTFKYTAINRLNVNDASGNDAGTVTNINHFVVEVEFTHDADYALTDLSIKCDCYTNDAGANIAGDLDVDNVDIEYAAQTGGIVIKPGASADTYVFTVKQTVGEKTFVSPYDKAYFTPDGFIVYYDEACTITCPSTVTVSVGGYARFYLEDASGMKFTTDSAADLSWTTSDESGLSCQFAIGNAFSFATSHVKFLAKVAGTYTVTLTYQGVTKTFTVNVVA